MLAVWVVGGAKIVEDRDGLNKALNSLRTEGCDAGRQNRPTAH
jgi:hypothetical protein